MPEAIGLSHVCGALAGFITETCLHPFDTVRARLQTSSQMYRGVCHALLTIQYREGMRAWYKGFPVVMVLSSPAHALYFGTYETAKEVLPKHIPWFRSSVGCAPPLSLSLACGMLADMAAELLWTPMDVIKQRQQIQTCRDSHYRSLQCGVSHIAATEGLSTFWRGYWLGVATLETPLYFTMFEQMMHHMTSGFGCPRDQLPIGIVSAMSFGSTALSAVLTNPIDVVRTRLMVTSFGATCSRRALHIARRTWQAEGVHAFIKGAPARVMYLAPNHCLAMTSFELISRWFRSRQDSLPVSGHAPGWW
uniref:Mitochondrial carrier protein n=1 Tax=Eutreptiella gymnastica TaxID=73025 RepID=A0A6U8JWW0_9EUGL